MKYGYISLDVIIRETIEDYALDNKELRESLLKRWAMDAVNMVPTTEELVHNIVHLPVTAGSAEMPVNFKSAQAVLGRLNPSEKRTYRVDKLVEWALPTADEDVSLIVRTVCNKCKKDKCECAHPHIEVDVDRVWEMAHPEAYLKRFTNMGQWGHGRGVKSAEDKTSDWQILKPMKGAFSNARHFLTDCANLNAPYEAPSFYFDLPYIKTGFMEGEIILSYLGRKLDEHGDVMVMENTDLIMAVKSHIMHMWFTRLYTRSIGAKTEASQQYLQAAGLMKQAREEHFAIYRDAVTQPEPAEFRDFMRNVWLRRMVDPHYDHNLGTAGRDRYAEYTQLFK